MSTIKQTSSDNSGVASVMNELQAVLIDRKNNGDKGKSYSATLLQSEDDVVLRKISEESTELILAVKEGKEKHIVHEAADLLFHLQVLLVKRTINISEVLLELKRRQGVSGITEKNSRAKV